MDSILSQASALAGQNIGLAYGVIYLAVIFLGNIAAFTSFWIAFQGGLGAWGVPFVALTIFLSGMTADSLWYTMGRKLRETGFGNWIKRRMPGHATFEDHIERRGRRWMLFAKFVYGTNFPLLFSIGWTRRIPLTQFLRNMFLALTIWLPVVLGVSYGLYASLSPLAALQHTFRDFELLIAGLLFFVILQYGLVAIFRRFFGRNGSGFQKLDK